MRCKAWSTVVLSELFGPKSSVNGASGTVVFRNALKLVNSMDSIIAYSGTVAAWRRSNRGADGLELGKHFPIIPEPTPASRSGAILLRQPRHNPHGLHAHPHHLTHQPHDVLGVVGRVRASKRPRK